MDEEHVPGSALKSKHPRNRNHTILSDDNDGLSPSPDQDDEYEVIEK